MTIVGFNNTTYKSKTTQTLSRALEGALCKGGALTLKLYSLHGESASGYYDTCTSHMLDRPEKGETDMKKIALQHNVFLGKQKQSL